MLLGPEPEPWLGLATFNTPVIEPNDGACREKRYVQCGHNRKGNKEVRLDLRFKFNGRQELCIAKQPCSECGLVHHWPIFVLASVSGGLTICGNWVRSLSRK